MPTDDFRFMVHDEDAVLNVNWLPTDSKHLVISYYIYSRPDDASWWNGQWARAI